jgi:hypothetical protein
MPMHAVIIVTGKEGARETFQDCRGCCNFFFPLERAINFVSFTGLRFYISNPLIFFISFRTLPRL